MLIFAQSARGFILTAINKAYYGGKINISDFNEMNIIIDNLNCYLGDIYGKYGDLEEEVRFMVKSFYAPKVEEKGREKGRDEARDEQRKKYRVKDIDRVLKLLQNSL